MRKIIAGINMTVDGVCDHTAAIADDALHAHYSELLKSASAILYGRITYGLMEYWRDVAAQPMENASEYDFAHTMDRIPKIVFSKTLKSLDWHSATLAQGSLEEEVKQLKQSDGGDILVGSPSLITKLLSLGLVDELQLCVHPVIAGGGNLLFSSIVDRILLKLTATKVMESGAIFLYYRPENSGN